MYVLDPIRDRELENEVALLYSDKLPYHNFQHVLRSLDYADSILRRCLDNQVQIDVKVVYLALLFHDAGYAEDHRKLGYPTKEAYSVYLARTKLEHRGVSPRQIQSVCTCIDGTETSGSFSTVESKVVRAADLAGMASSYEVFLANNLKLFQEVEILGGVRPDWESWKAQVKKRIEFYLSQKIEITPGDSSESFHKGTRTNLERFLKEPGPV